MKRDRSQDRFGGPRVPNVVSLGKTARWYLRRLYASLTLALGLLLVAAVLHFPKAEAQNNRSRFQQDLAQVFTHHEELSLDPHAVAQEVRTSGRVELVTGAHDFQLQLQLNDLRAPNYRAEEIDPDGVTRATAMPGVSTYKGKVAGVWDSDARFLVRDDKFEGMIITPANAYFVEPAQKYSPSATQTDYLLYTATDARPDITRTCGDTLEEQINTGAKQMMEGATAGVTPAVFSPVKAVEIATEADLEYTNKLGGASAANSDILSIMNSISAIYERDIGLTFTVTYQHAWVGTADPYGANGSGATAVLQAFTNYWNQNPPSLQHDVSHLWTGKQLTDPNGNIVNGVAWEGVVCSRPSSAYGISDFENMAPFRITIAAHEIGHNFGANHTDDPQFGSHPECDNTIMVSVQTPNTMLVFCPFSVNEITTYVQANSSCLADQTAGNPIDQTDFFVRQHYADFLNRTPDASGLAFWDNQIDQCGADTACWDVHRVNTSGAFFLSIEFQQTGYLVERAYKTAYGDFDGPTTLHPPSIKVPIVRFNEFLNDQRAISNGVIVNQGDWQTTLENNKVAYFNNFVQTTRFIGAYPANMLPTDFVHRLNGNAGGPISTTEEAQEAVALATGSKTRAQVVRDIAEHPNLARSELNRAFVLMQYCGYLRRNPNDAPDADYTGYDFWLTKLNQFNGDYVAAEMVKAFINSAEYRRRFGTP